jgi:hypothetical protein
MVEGRRIYLSEKEGYYLRGATRRLHFFGVLIFTFKLLLASAELVISFRYLHLPGSSNEIFAYGTYMRSAVQFARGANFACGCDETSSRKLELQQCYAYIST